MLRYALTGLAFVMLTAGALHFAVGFRRRGDRVHLSFGLAAVLFGVFSLLSVPLIGAETLEEARYWLDLKRLASWAAWLAFLWFALEFTGRRRMRWVLLIFAPPMYFIFPDQFGAITAIRPVVLPWGETITGFVGSGGPLGYLYMVLSVAALAYVGYAAIQLGREERARGWVFAVALLFFALSVLDDLIPPIASFGDELGFALFVLLMNLYLIDDAVEVFDARRAAQLSRARLQALVDTSPEAILIVDAQTNTISSVNAPALESFGAALLGQPWTTLLDSSLPMQRDGLDAETKLQNLFDRALAGERVISEWTLEGESEPVPCELRVVRLAGESLLRVSFIDLSAQERAERRREMAEEQLRRAERLNALGEMTSRIAHDLNNLLLPIMARADLAAERAERDPELKRDLEAIIRSSERASELAKQVLRFSAGRSRGESCDVVAVVNALVPLLQTAAPKGIQIVVDAPESLEAVIPPARLEQVITNLVMNAFHASPPDSSVRIECRPLDETGSIIRVVDRGTGIEPAALERIFEPFFSTKGPEKGTGLGLAIVRDLIREAEGEIEVDSRVGHGTTFTISLPRRRFPPIQEHPSASTG